MKIYSVGLFYDGPFMVSRVRHVDQRGSFEMAFEFAEIRTQISNFPEIQQINLLNGTRGSVRGFHYSEVSKNHWKVVTPVCGEIRDAFLDVRMESETFGMVGYIDLNPQDLISIVIPPGFAHGVQTLSQSSVTIYGTNIAFRDNSEISINPMKSGLDQVWIDTKILSTRDEEASHFPAETKIFELSHSKKEKIR